MSSTIRDIAKAAQVSAATVSLVLNGKGGISEETRARVLKAASGLNYSIRERKVGKTIRSRTLRFLKIAKHGHTVNRDHNTFISDYIDGMSLEADRRGYKLEVLSYEGTPIEQIVESIAGNDLAGVIVLGTELSESDIRLFGSTPAPLVFIDTYYEFLESNFVDMNNKDAVYKVLSYLVAQGFRRIGFIASNVQTRNFHLRTEAFTSCMRALQLEIKRADIVTVDSTLTGAYQDMSELLRQGLDLPECFFSSNDIIAYGCIKALREFNVRLPEDLSIIGFDNLPMSSAMSPALTTIDVSKRQIGYLAISALHDLIHADQPLPPVKTLVGANLVVRDSVIPRSKGAAP